MDETEDGLEEEKADDREAEDRVGVFLPLTTIDMLASHGSRELLVRGNVVNQVEMQEMARLTAPSSTTSHTPIPIPEIAIAYAVN